MREQENEKCQVEKKKPIYLFFSTYAGLNGTDILGCERKKFTSFFV